MLLSAYRADRATPNAPKSCVQKCVTLVGKSPPEKFHLLNSSELQVPLSRTLQARLCAGSAALAFNAADRVQAVERSP